MASSSLWLSGWAFNGDAKKRQLSFPKKAVVEIKQEITNKKDWSWCQYNGVCGFAPRNYLKTPYIPEPEPEPEPEVQEEEEPQELTQIEKSCYSWASDVLGVAVDATSSWMDGEYLRKLVNHTFPCAIEEAQFQLAVEQDAVLQLIWDTVAAKLELKTSLTPEDVFSAEGKLDSLSLCIFLSEVRDAREMIKAAARAEAYLNKLDNTEIDRPNSELIQTFITDKEGRLHAFVDIDGNVRDRYNNFLGAIWQDRAVDSQSMPVAYILSDQVYSMDEELLMEIDRGSGSLHSDLGSTILEMSNSGHAKGGTGTFLGCFEQWSFADMNQIALFNVVDPTFADEDFYAPAPHIDAPPADKVFCNIWNRGGSYRSSIHVDTRVTNNTGELIGYLDFEGLRAASTEQQLLGSVVGSQVWAADEEFQGEFDQGKGLVFAANGSSICSMDGTGACKGATEVNLGRFQGFTYAELPVIALYVLFLDQTFVVE